MAKLPKSEGTHKRHQEERYAEVCSSRMAASAGKQVAEQARLLLLWPTPVSEAGVECKIDSMQAALRPTDVCVSG